MRTTSLIAAGMLASAMSAEPESPSQKDRPASQVIHIDDVCARQQAGCRSYEEFLSVPAMSLGVYALAAGATDTQKPHDQDEVYYVLEGNATFFADGKRQPVRPGSVIYVRREGEHRFEEITKDLRVLVVFAAERD